MTSEIENFLRDDVQVVRKVDADKAIGVSTANLTADEKGEVPLSKQSAFELPTTAVTAEATQTVVAPAEVTEELDLTPKAPTPGTPEPPAAAVVSDTIEEEPVAVKAPTELGGLDIGSIIPDIPLVTDQPEAETKEEVKEEVKLPEATGPVLAEEPTGVNEALFVGTTTSAEPESTLTTTPEPERSVDLGVTVETPASALETTPEQEPEPAVETTTTLEGLDLSTPDVAPETTSVEVKEEGLESLETKTDVLPGTVPTVDLNVDQEKPAEEIPTVNVTEPVLNALDGEEKKDNQEEVKDSKLDIIYNKLCDIDNTLNEIKDRFEVHREEVELSEEPNIKGLPQEPAIPNPDIPAFIAPAEPPQEEMVDALSQIGENEVGEIDETPIKGGGGMFI